ncbi:hypothetical protein COB57_06145 [Candidatus Peregrinibacteria bacterium]|nr:MAG: hypothetical protein COB57_06145 [Candidatus Peregrinibacteria bacterium]
MIFDIIILVVFYLIGTIWIEDAHIKSLEKREKKYKDFFITTIKTFDTNAEKAFLVSGSAVIASDIFKKYIASWICFFGGRIQTFEKLLDRAKRESLVRMCEQAKKKGAHGIINIRYETSSISKGKNKKSISAAESLVYGTAVVLKK